ncbi:MAG: SH3 domain-containing protein [Nitrospinaceae bacterium]|nr:SH3 domain-containing protein [Nitrospinaceae bacterium]NIR54248.1 SH3 domain-containing protein [Nitrospinaceae bacterium]NIS84665.1 SH3 domain-containing protein [Nitrospinaceae bacterium]NIT81460.1 SH3 domain-containing protein [Nitrospinaceae bacterium]NIU43744.1 SH3 domain-containing protein [Nitrospinaceae bacterium]
MRLHSFQILLIVLLVIAFLAPVTVWADTWYVKSSRAKMTQKASARSKKLADLPVGAAVEVLEKGKRFYRISFKGKSGYVFKFKLTDKAPAQSRGGGNSLDLLIGQQQMAAAESTSGSSIRGLHRLSEEQSRSKGIKPVHIQAVKDMEAYKVKSQDIDQFLKQGRLGEYVQ